MQRQRRLVTVAMSVATTVTLISCSGDSTQPAAPSGTPGVSGVVTDVVAGSPISGVSVGIQGKTATTGSDGRYSITGLTAGTTALTAQHQGHVNFTQNVTIASTTLTSDIRLTPSNAAKMNGSWTGTWRNATFATTGGITMSVTTDTVAQTMQVVLDVNGNVFGLSDPPAETFSGSYSPTTGATLTRTSTVFGSVTITVTPTGQISGSVTNVPVSGISRMDFTGTVSVGPPAVINLSYTVTFTSGGVATGIATLTHS